MSEPRTNSEILIKRVVVDELQGTSTADVVSVPITPKCVRRFTLMQEDYIQLEFSLPSAVHIAIGDYFDDDLFGRFVCTEEQMPKYNTKTGGYDYSIRFDAEYMVWKNWVHCMTVIAGGVKQRMETEWGLTDQLSTHAQQIADEVNLIIGERQDIPAGPGEPTPSNGYCVDVTAEKKREIHYIAYNGSDIISAMNMIAEAWQCEWWVTHEQKVVDDVLYSKVIHFGKCENAGTGYDFRLGHNVESMDINRDQQSFANRVFAFGGTRNVPEDYDRKLEFVVTDTGETQASKYWALDSKRPLKANMVLDNVNGSTIIPNDITTWVKELSYGTYTVRSAEAAPDTYFIDGYMTPSFTLPTTYKNAITSVSFDIYIGGVSIGHEVLVRDESMEDMIDNTTWSKRMRVFYPGITLAERGRIEIKVIINVSNSGNYSGGVYGLSLENMIAKGSDATQGKNIVIEFNGEEYDAVLNDGHYGKYSDEASQISNIRRTENGSTVYAKNEGFGVGSKFTVKEDYLDMNNVPNSYYTPIYDTGVLSKVGEKRIHMPNHSYVEVEGLAHMTQVVEEVVLFEDIFPKMNLKITEIRTEPKTEDITHDDGSVSRQNWNQYIFKASKDDDTEFVFNTKYIMDGNKLQAVFTSPPPEMYESGFMLSGMTFDVGFNNNSQEYTIIRNEDFGAKFPNDLVFPQVGDTFFLTGWNPKSIKALTLVTDAERDTAVAAQEYLDAIQAGQFTFNCRMMSNWFFDLEADRFFVLPEDESEDNEPFFTFDNNAFYVGNGFTRYRLPQAGDIVTVYHDALKGGSKTSRIIGYEFKLDKPYDTPTYVVGETEAFSRLKQIEKKLTKL